MAELKPCPFCGGEAELRIASEIWNCDGSVSIGGWKVGCTECGIETYLENRDTAIEKWNRRNYEKGVISCSHSQYLPNRKEKPVLE